MYRFIGLSILVVEILRFEISHVTYDVIISPGKYYKESYLGHFLADFNDLGIVRKVSTRAIQ